MTSTIPQPMAPVSDGAPVAPVADGAPVAPGAPGGYPPDFGFPPAKPDRIGAFFARIERYTPRWLAPLAVAGGCAAASGFVLWYNPTDIPAGTPPTCLVRLTTGYDCPGCGGTRALWFLLHGDLPAAAQHHMVAVFAVPFLVYAWIAWTAGAVFRRRLPQLRVSFKTIGFGLLAWAVFTVLRNLPFEPFSWFYV